MQLTYESRLTLCLIADGIGTLFHSTADDLSEMDEEEEMDEYEEYIRKNLVIREISAINFMRGWFDVRKFCELVLNGKSLLVKGVVNTIMNYDVSLESAAKEAGEEIERTDFDQLFAELYDERLAQCMRMWRMVGRVAGKLATWHKRAVKRAYAPGGIGYLEVKTDFERASKSQRTCE